MPAIPPRTIPSSEATDSFSLTSTDNRFKSRSADVFAGLATLEQKHDAVVEVQSKNKSPDEKEHLEKPDPVDNPTDPQPRRRGGGRGGWRGGGWRAGGGRRFTPDFRKNPGKWTAYDLSDVPRDQLSDRANSAAAFDFLSERKRQRVGGVEEKAADLSEKVQFARPGLVSAAAEDSEEPVPSGSQGNKGLKMKFRGGTRVMPEYVVGGGGGGGPSKPKQKRPASSSIGSANSVSLNYLEDNLDDEKMGSTSFKNAARSEISLESEENEKSNKKEGKGKSENETDPETAASGIKFRKVSSKKGIRRKRASDDESD